MDTVFIVRPFGNNRPVIKKNKDGVPEIVFFDFDKVETDLIIPAMQKAGLQGGTTQRIFESGEIKEDMFSELLLADVVIADITIHNANVFYELGIRHALRKKTTILIKCDGFDETPFDIIGYKYLGYKKDDPAAVLNDLVDFLKGSTDSIRKDSPVFNMLPQLDEPETEKFLAVPEEFGEEVTIATKAGMIGKLNLLSIESKNFKWELQANRYLGESFFSLKCWEDCRKIWECVKTEDIHDLQANDRLSTVYQRLADAASTINPVKAKELLALSDDAIAIMEKKYNDLDISKRAEIYALKGRNAKTKWINEWKNIPDDKKEQVALRSVNLEEAYKNYERAYFENLNHYYSGINAMALLTVIITLAKRYPDKWAQVHDDDDNTWKIEKLEDRFKKLWVSMQFSLEAEKRRLRQMAKTDIWYDITEADLLFLTSPDPEKIAVRYTRALENANNFPIESVEKQLMLYGRLNILTANVKAVLEALPPKQDVWDKVHYLLFTGHMIDKPGRPEARFPSAKAPVVKQQILEKIKEVLSSLDQGINIIGIAGGACGGDILFHEACRELNIKTQLFLAMPREDFLVASVSFAGPDWINRFDKIYEDTATAHFELSDKKELPKWLKKKNDYSIWQRNNLWELNSALVKGGMNMTMVALWDGKGEDGPGGTADMVQQAGARGAKVITIDMNTV